MPGLESDNPPTRVGFDSQWALPMSCCFCIFCSSSLGILNQATQEVLSGRVGSLCPPLKNEMKNARREQHTTKEKHDTHKNKKTKTKHAQAKTTAPAAEMQVQVCYMPRYGTLRKREKHHDNHANKGNQEV